MALILIFILKENEVNNGRHDNNRIVINDVIFSDYDETDYQSSINDEESLELMNLGC